jgi:signal peptidase I
VADTIERYWQTPTILLVVLGVTFAQPGWSDSSSSADPVYSEPFCLKIFEEVAEKARSGSWQISDRDRHILTQCRAKFPPTVNAQIPLPTATECIFVVKTLVEGGLSKVKEIELPEEKVRSIERCDEVLKYYSMPSANMLPTLKLNQKLVVDKTSYQTQAPQRGDIVVFNPPNLDKSESDRQPLTRRMIGLPGETVRIENGKVYINGKFYREDYLTQPATGRSQSFPIPKNSYLVIGDNRNTPDPSIVVKSSIVGKVVWHF